MADINELPDFVPEPKSTTPKQPDPLELLRNQLDSERRARIDAEKRANEAAQNAHAAQIDVQDNQMQLVTSAIARVQEATDQLEAAYEQAMLNGDARACAKIQREMASNEAKLLQLENGKAAMEAQPKPQPPQPIQHTPSDPVEALATQLSPRSAAWVRAHPEYARDKRLEQKMLAAHNLTVADGVEVDTDEYFAGVEAALGIKSASEEAADNPLSDAANEVETPVPRPVAPPPAPVSRGGGNSSNRGKLTLAEQEAAECSGISYEEYARNREQLKKEGRYH